MASITVLSTRAGVPIAVLTGPDGGAGRARQIADWHAARGVILTTHRYAELNPSNAFLEGALPRLRQLNAMPR